MTIPIFFQMSKWCNVHQRTMKILFSSHHHKQKNNNFNNTFSLKLNLEMKRINVYLIIIIICLQVLFNFVKTFFQTKGHKHFLNNRICHLHRFPFISYLVICVTWDAKKNSSDKNVHFWWIWNRHHNSALV